MAKAAVKRRARGSMNYKALAIKAKDLIVKEQKCDYAFLQEKLSIGAGQVRDVLGILRKQGVVGQVKGRKWAVLLNKDGSKKDGIEVLPPKRRKPRKSQKSRKSSRAAKAGPATAVAARSDKLVKDDEEVVFLKGLAAAIGGPQGQILTKVAKYYAEFLEIKSIMKDFEG